jgi:hypothetical protein
MKKARLTEEKREIAISLPNFGFFHTRLATKKGKNAAIATSIRRKKRNIEEVLETSDLTMTTWIENRITVAKRANNALYFVFIDTP